MRLQITDIKFRWLEENNYVVKVPKDLLLVKQWLEDYYGDKAETFSDVQALIYYVRTMMFYNTVDCKTTEMKLIYGHLNNVWQPFIADVADDKSYEEYDAYQVAIFHEPTVEVLISADDIMYHKFDTHQELVDQAAFEWLCHYLQISFSFLKL